MHGSTRITRGIGAVILTVGLTGGGLFGAPSAGAAPTATAPVATTADSPPAGYEYAGEFFWGSSCDEAGQAGMNRGWSDYVCIGSWNDNYDLWIKPTRR